jgi:SAM-dependent methyltransferase
MGSAERQGAIWSAGARAWADLLEIQHAPIYDAAFDAIDIGSGTKLLDAGCGAGLALDMARARGADVAGFDAAEGLLAIAKERLPLEDLRQGDLEQMPYEDDSFDAVTAFNSVQFTSEPLNALREIRRVCKPGQPVAVTVWAPAQENDMRFLLKAVGELHPPQPPGVEPTGPFTLSRLGELEGLAQEAGLAVGEAVVVPTPFRYQDKETAVRGMLGTGPGAIAVANSGEERTRAVLAEAYEQFVQDDGSVVLNNKFRVLPATA